MTPAVSIVVPCFNGGAFLESVVESVARQTYRDFEIIIVNDGSTDEATLRKLEELQSHARIIHQDNQGLPAARNAGFQAARGEFVLPLDCDDRIEPSYLSEAVALLDDAPSDVGFVFCDMRLTGRMSGTLRRYLCAFDQLFLNRLPYCMLIRKSAWRRVGGYDADMREGYEDWDFNLRMIEAGVEGLKLANPLFVYRVSLEGMLFSQSARRHGRLWARLRRAHPKLYDVTALRRTYAACRDPRPRIGLATGLLLLYAGQVLPERAISFVYFLALRASHKFRSIAGAAKTNDQVRT